MTKQASSKPRTVYRRPASTGPLESTVLREEPETLDTELLQEEEAEAKAVAEKERPGLTMFTDGSQLDNGAAGYAVVWLQPGGLRCRVRCSRKGTGSGLAKTDHAGAGHDLHGRAGSHQKDGLGRTRPRPAVRAAGQEAHRGAMKSKARHHHRDPMVPGLQGYRRQREGRRVDEDRSGGARHPRGGMAELLGPFGGPPNAAPPVSGEPQAGDLREEVGGGVPMGGGSNLQEEAPHAGQSKA